MIKKTIIHIIFFLGLFISSSLAQNESDYKDLQFYANPKHQSELGLSVGVFMVLGDIQPQSSWGAGLHFRRSIDYAFSWRIDALYGVAKGLEPRNSGGSTSSAAAANYVLNGSLNNGINYTANDWYHNYQTKFMSLTLQGVWSLNSFNFKKVYRKTNIYILGGIGVNSFQTFYDAKNSSGIQHDFDNVGYNLDTNGSKDDRNKAENRIKSILDGNYETRAEIASGRYNNDDPESFHLNFHANAGVGVSFKINENLNISIEQQVTFVFGNDADLLDGYRWRNSTNLTQNIDLASYTCISFNFNIGKKEKRSEPLWWVSPVTLMADELADVKARPEFDATDNDNDGVVDMLDEELDTPEGFPVDTKGVQLDSDSDGIADGNDKERYSPPGYNVDAEGIAQVPAPDHINTENINRIVETILSEYSKTADAASDWWLPIVYFDLNSSKIKDSEVGILRNVAGVMMAYPNKRVVVIGHADQSSNSCYSDFLSYNRAEEAINYLVSGYGIPRDRFILNWSGEGDNLVDPNIKGANNSRVEFRVATNEREEGLPHCTEKTGKEGVPPASSTDSDEIAGSDVKVLRIGFDKIVDESIDGSYSFAIEIQQGEYSGFTVVGKTKDIYGQYKEPILKTVEVENGEILIFELVSSNGDVEIKSSPEGSSIKKKYDPNRDDNKVFNWSINADNVLGSEAVQLNIYTHPVGDDSSLNRVYSTRLPVEIMEEPVASVKENQEFALEEMSSKVSGFIIAALLLVIIVLLSVLIFVILFYKRKEKEKIEAKEKVFPQKAIVFLEEVKHIIGDGDTDTAIQKLLQYFEEQEKLRDELLQLRAQYQHYKSQQRKGLLNPSDTITLNRINNAIMELINESKNKLVIN